MTTPKPVVLCILDGWGKRAETTGNAPALANTPAFDKVMQGPTAELITHGPDVGLPKGQMGNSEVGHTNIGAGRVVAMDLGAIDLAIEEGSFFDNDALVRWAEKLKTNGGTAHIMGLVSDGGVHGHVVHIQAALKAVVDRGVPVILHAITDGRDVSPKSGVGFLNELIANMPEGVVIGSICGRYYAMDRDNRWERVETAYRAMVEGTGPKGGDAVGVVEAAYADDVTDEFIPATVLGEYAGMSENDGVFCLNFRADRAREILASMGDPAFDGFDVADRPTLDLLGMVDYSTSHNTYMTTCYPKQDIKNTLGAWVASKGLRQFRVAETEKYPHVTFFLNGGVEEPEAGEVRYMAPSPKVATYDLQPEMSAAEVADAFVGAIEDGYDLIVCNFANPDMVGHTGIVEAAVKACETIDEGVRRVTEETLRLGGKLIITADHGNCEKMINPDGSPHTAHTTYLVHAIYVADDHEKYEVKDGILADVAPTLLDMMGLKPSAEMTGKSLLKKK